MQKSASLGQLARALTAASGQLSRVIKNASNESAGSAYADLGAVLELVKPVLSEHGLTVVQSPTQTGNPGEVGLTTLILHESGEWLEDISVMSVVPGDPWAYGSAISYMRRYSLAAMLSIYASDDDGQAARPAAPAAPAAQAAASKVKAEQKVEKVEPAAPADGISDDDRAKMEKWFTTISNASLERLNASRSSIATNFSGKALELVEKAFDARIEVLQAQKAATV
jgi:hypothetical protein